MATALRRFAVEREGARTPVCHRPGEGRRWVLFLHGACADHHTFDAQLPAFDTGDDLLLPDLRGQGRSVLAAGVTADFEGIVGDLLALLDDQGVGSVTVVGHSFGSHLAQELAWRHPERVERLVLIGCYDQHAPRTAAERARVALTSAVGVGARADRRAECGVPGRRRARDRAPLSPGGPHRHERGDRRVPPPLTRPARLSDPSTTPTRTPSRPPLHRACRRRTPPRSARAATRLRSRGGMVVARSDPAGCYSSGTVLHFRAP